ncbi:hypothetical protein NW768_008246 [Fusarium equiseti]|uniref:Uncharacterized protein n=1 Tax=Fusarium equiseti TaxID=61235 RepID=A0ABQ8R679_FUSEQ|nr:hypothetical protein NW768_008246 [Fusarium equiseti]
MRVSIILLTGASGLGALAQVPNHLNKRAACNRDNLFRCFLDQRYSSQASDFCAELAPFTATVSTSIATVTITVEATITADAIEATEVHTTTTFTEIVPSTTIVVTAGAAAAVKRQAAANPPKCMTNGVTYPASRITSACSCIDMPVLTVSVTHAISTETVTEIRNTAVTPYATVTSWARVSAAMTSGTSTVTVLPPGKDRLVNGGFETGDSTGWELTPDSWKGEIYNSSNRLNTWGYVVYGAEGSLGTLRQVRPVYLEAGRYEVGMSAPLAQFPKALSYWEQVVGYELVNHARGTTVTSKFPLSKRTIVKGRFVIPLQHWFNIPEAAEGYYEFSFKFLEQPPEKTVGDPSIDDLYLKRV